MNIKSELLEFVLREPEKALKYILTLLKEREGDPYDSYWRGLATLQSRHLYGCSQFKIGILKYDDWSLIRTQIVLASIEMIDEFPSEFFKFSKKNLDTFKIILAEMTIPPESRSPEPLVPEVHYAKRTSGDNDFEFDFFFSFSSKDHDDATRIVSVLKKYGYKVFFSTDTLKASAGKSFLEKISYALKNSRHFIWHCTPNSSTSVWVKSEYEAFYANYHVYDPDKRCFYVLQGNGFRRSDIPNLFTSIQCAKMVEEILGSLSPTGLFLESPVDSPVQPETYSATEPARPTGGEIVFTKSTPIVPKPIVREDTDLSCWLLAEKANTLFALKNYLKRFPKGKFVSYAETAIKVILAQRVEPAPLEEVIKPAMTPDTPFEKPLDSSHGVKLIVVGDKFGFRNASGKTIVEPIYERVFTTSEDAWIAVKAGLWGVLNKNGQEISAFDYDQIWDFDDGIAVFQKNNRYGCIDREGFQFPDLYDEIFPFSNGFAVVNINNKMGFLDKTGRMITAIKYDKAFSFSEGFAGVVYKGKAGFIDNKGIIRIKLQYDSVEPFSQGLAVVALDGKKGYIDTSGAVVIPIEYSNALSFREGLAVVVDEGVGYIDMSGELVIPCTFEEARSFSQGLGCVKKDSKYGYIDPLGNVSIDFQFDEAYSFDASGLASVRIGREQFKIDKNGIQQKDTVATFDPVLRIYKGNPQKETSPMKIFIKKSK